VLWQAQFEAQKSAAKFQHANGLYRAAKETVALAEESLLNSDDGGKIVLDAAWQDMLNHATAKVCSNQGSKKPFIKSPTRWVFPAFVGFFVYFVGEHC